MEKNQDETPRRAAGSEGSGIPPGSLDRLRDSNEYLTFAALHAREEADDAEVRYRDLVEDLEAIVWEATAAPWRFTFVSERAAAMLGYPTPHWTASSDFWEQIIHPEGRAAALAVLHAQAADLTDFRLQFRMVGSGGQSQWIAMIGRHSRQADFRGYYRGLFVSIEDAIRADTLQAMVTEQTRTLLSQQEDMRKLGTALNLAEHRVRTNVAAELHDHLAQMLVLGRLKLDQAQHVKTLSQAREYIAQTEAVLTDCLNYTRTLVAELSPPVLQEFGLPAALTWLSRHMRRYDLLVTCEFPTSAPWTISHEEAVLLFQSVRELLINIAKHAETGKATVRLHAEDERLHLSVQDQGRGFDPSALTQREASQSSKFGLFSIRERMRALGGAFEITSAPGAGTRSMLTLPLRASIPAAAAPAFRLPGAVGGPHLTAQTAPDDDHQPPPSPARIRVLLVDDHAMLRERLRGIVNAHAQLEVIAEASNGIEAVDAVRAFHPDVVVMDLNMPRMNGMEAARLIKREFPQIGIAGLSIHNAGEMVEGMAGAGISAYVKKEAAGTTLCPAIEEAAARRV